jgi:hypothetical protein
MIKTMILLDSRTKINVMTRQLMNIIDIVMRSDSRLKLISYIEHDMNFDEICDNVEVNIDELRTLHHIFVMSHANHQLVLEQSFLMNVFINYDYRNDEVYVIIFNSKFTQFVIFKTLDRNDHANKDEKKIFSETSSLN